MWSSCICTAQIQSIMKRNCINIKNIRLLIQAISNVSRMNVWKHSARNPFHSTILCYRELTLYIILTKIFINFKSRKETFYIQITQCHWVMYEYQYDDIQQNIIKRCVVELCLPFLLSNFTHWLTVSVEWALIEFWSNLYDAAQARLLMHTRARKKIQLLKPTDAVHQQYKWVQYQTMFVTRKCCTLLITGFPILCWHLEFGLFSSFCIVFRGSMTENVVSS